MPISHDFMVHLKLPKLHDLFELSYMNPVGPGLIAIPSTIDTPRIPKDGLCCQIAVSVLHRLETPDAGHLRNVSVELMQQCCNSKKPQLSEKHHTQLGFGQLCLLGLHD